MGVSRVVAPRLYHRLLVQSVERLERRQADVVLVCERQSPKMRNIDVRLGEVTVVVPAEQRHGNLRTVLSYRGR